MSPWITSLLFGAFFSVTGSDIINYFLNCRDFDLVQPHNITCPGETFSLTCSSQEVVVAMPCFGKSTNSIGCNHSNGDCLGPFWESSDNILVHNLEQCLWTSNTCSVTTKSTSFRSFKAQCNGNSFLIYDYLGSFDYSCVPATMVHDVCSSPDVPVSLANNVGYVLSPGFPAKVGDKNCTTKFVFECSGYYLVKFFIHHLQVDQNNGDHVAVGYLDHDGRFIRVATWAGSRENITFYMETQRDFVVELKMSSINNLRGFLLSYEVSEAIPPTSQTPIPTTSTIPEVTSTKSSRSSLENAGIALSVLFPVCILVIVGLVIYIVLLRRDRIQAPQANGNVYHNDIAVDSFPHI